MSADLADYQIERQIGTGARSRIFAALEVKSRRRIALKRVLRNSAADDPFLRQVEIEYEVARHVEHAHVRGVLALHRVRKMLQVRELVLAMEFVDGLPLEKALPNRLDRFLSIFIDAASGLEAIHRAGFVHADIKPHNIMRGRGGLLKIIDLGQASPIGKRKERIQGTPDFIAPEQVHRKILNERTDVFNLGASMYWVLTTESYPTEIAGQTGRGVAITPTQALAPIEINAKIPRSLSDLVMECCRSSPSQRPADMAELRARLTSIRALWNKRRQTLKEAHLAKRQQGEADELTRSCE